MFTYRIYTIFALYDLTIFVYLLLFSAIASNKRMNERNEYDTPSHKKQEICEINETSQIQVDKKNWN